MTDSVPPPVRRLHLIFDLQRGRLVARDFLRELSDQKWPLQVTGASRREAGDPAKHALVVVEGMRRVQVALVLVTTMASASRNVTEEVAFAKPATLRLAGFLLAGPTAHPQTNGKDTVWGKG